MYLLHCFNLFVAPLRIIISPPPLLMYFYNFCFHHFFFQFYQHLFFSLNYSVIKLKEFFLFSVLFLGDNLLLACHRSKTNNILSKVFWFFTLVKNNQNFCFLLISFSFTFFCMYCFGDHAVFLLLQGDPKQTSRNMLFIEKLLFMMDARKKNEEKTTLQQSVLITFIYHFWGCLIDFW